MNSPLKMGVILVLFIIFIYSRVFAIEVLDETPQHNTTGNALNSQVMFKIVSYEVATGVNLGTVDVNINEEHYDYLTEGFNSTYLGQQYEGDSYRILITPSEPFDYGEIVSVEVSAQDYTGAAMVPFSWSFTILDDNTAPIVWNQIPAPEESGIEVDQVILFNVTDGISGVNLETLAVEVETTQSSMNSVYTIDDLLQYSLINNGFTFTLDLEDNFSLADTVNVSITARDNAGNITIEPYSFYIKTGLDYTYTTNYSPQPSEDDVMIDSEVSFDIYNMIEGVYVDTLMLAVTIQGQQYTYLNSENFELEAIDNQAGENIGYHVNVTPGNQFEFGQLVVVQIEAKDTSGIDMETVHYSFMTIYDHDAPYIGSRIPANNEIDVAIDSDVSFQIVDVLSGVDLTALEVWINGTLYSYLDDSFSSVQIENGYQVNVTPDFLPPDTVIPVEITAEDFLGNQVMDNYSFHTEIVSSNTDPPFILNYEPEDGAINLPLETSIMLTVFDSDPGIDVSSVFMRVNGEDVTPLIEPDLNYGLTEQGFYAACNVTYIIEATEAGEISWGVSVADMIGNIYNPSVSEEYSFHCIESIPPEINLPEEFSFLEDSLLVIDFAELTSDPDGDFEIEYSGNNNILIDIDEYVVTFSAAENWYGSETIEFSVTDGYGGETDQVLVNVLAVNDAPILDIPVDEYAVYEDSSLTVDFTSFIDDVDGDEIILTATGMENVDIEIIEYLVVISAEDNWFGSEDVTFSIYDNGSRLGDSETIEIIIESVNDLPVMDLPEEITLTEDTLELIDFNLYISDIEEDDLEFSFYGNNQINIQLDQLMVLFTPADNWYGTEEITFQVRDIESVWVEAEVSVNVEAVNDDPVLALPELFEFYEDEELIIDISQYASDVDGDELLVFCNNSAHTSVMINSLVLTLLPAENWSGDDLISVYIDDHNGGVAAGVINISVLPVNDSPEIDLPENVIIHGDSTLVVDFSNYLMDIDNDLEELSLEADGNQHINVEIFDLLVSFYTNDQWQGQEEIIFTVSDGESIPSQSSILVIAEQENINHPPEINLPPSFTFNEDEQMTIDFSEYIYDPDDDQMIISYSGNNFIDINVLDYNVSLSAEPDWNGNEVVSFTVYDSRSNTSANEDVLISVNPINDAPFFEPIYDIIIEQDQVINVDLGVYANDLEGDLFTLTLSEGTGVAIEQNGTVFTIIPQEGCPPVQNLTLTAEETISGLQAYTMLGLFVLQPVVDLSAIEDAVKAGEFVFEEGSGIVEIDFTRFINMDYDNVVLDSPFNNIPSDTLEISIEGFDVRFEPQGRWIGNIYIPFSITYLQSRARRDFEVRVTIAAAKKGEYVEPIPHLVSWEWEYCDIFITTEEPLAEVSCKILDKRGRMIKELQVYDDGGSSGRYLARWNKMDEDDHTVGGGLYIYRADINGRIHQGTIIIAR